MLPTIIATGQKTKTGVNKMHATTFITGPNRLALPLKKLNKESLYMDTSILRIKGVFGYGF